MASLVESNDSVVGRERFSQPCIGRSLHQVSVQAEERRPADGSRRRSSVEIGQGETVVVECVPLKTHRSLNRCYMPACAGDMRIQAP